MYPSDLIWEDPPPTICGAPKNNTNGVTKKAGPVPLIVKFFKQLQEFPQRWAIIMTVHHSGGMSNTYKKTLTKYHVNIDHYEITTRVSGSTQRNVYARYIGEKK